MHGCDFCLVKQKQTRKGFRDYGRLWFICVMCGGCGCTMGMQQFGRITARQWAWIHQSFWQENQISQLKSMASVAWPYAWKWTKQSAIDKNNHLKVVHNIPGDSPMLPLTKETDSISWCFFWERNLLHIWGNLSFMIRAPHRRWKWYIGRPQTFRNSGKCGQRHRKWSIWAYYLHISSFGPWLWQPAHIECSINVKITNINIIICSHHLKWLLLCATCPHQHHQ